MCIRDRSILAGTIILKQRGTKFHPGLNVRRANDDSLFSGTSVSANTSLGTPTSHASLGGKITIKTDTGGNQSSTSFTVSGTDMAGNSISEIIFFRFFLSNLIIGVSDGIPGLFTT